MHTNNNLESIRQLLESRLKDAARAKGSRESIHIQQVADPVDMTMQAAERELAMYSLDRHTMLARQLRLAINRIKDGTYGICRECEEEIAPKRLKAIPWAQLCIEFARRRWIDRLRMQGLSQSRVITAWPPSHP